MNSRRYAAVIVLSLLLIVGAVPGLPSVQAQDVATDLATTCSAQKESIATGERPQLLAAVPPGIAVTALAYHPAVQLPEGIDYFFSLDRLTLVTGAETRTRRTVGPTLFLVQDGTMAVIDSGHPRQFGPGESALVERNRLVKLENTGDQVGSVLVLGLLPPQGRLPIGPDSDPASLWIPLPEERDKVDYLQVLSGEVVALAREETLLFAACLHWTNPAPEIPPARYPGPVGVLVLRGEALVNDTERIGTGDCWLSPSYTSLRIRAGEQAPDIVFFGALRNSAQPEIVVGGGDSSASLECVGPTATDGA